MREAAYATRHLQVGALLGVLRFLCAHRGAAAAEVADAAGISLATLNRLLAAAERDLGVVIGGRYVSGRKFGTGLYIESWGVLSRTRVLAAD